MLTILTGIDEGARAILNGPIYPCISPLPHQLHRKSLSSALTTVSHSHPICLLPRLVASLSTAWSVSILKEGTELQISSGLPQSLARSFAPHRCYINVY